MKLPIQTNAAVEMCDVARSKATRKVSVHCHRRQHFGRLDWSTPAVAASMDGAAVKPPATWSHVENFCWGADPAEADAEPWASPRVGPEKMKRHEILELLQASSSAPVQNRSTTIPT